MPNRSFPTPETGTEIKHVHKQCYSENHLVNQGISKKRTRILGWSSVKNTSILGLNIAYQHDTNIINKYINVIVRILYFYQYIHWL